MTDNCGIVSDFAASRDDQRASRARLVAAADEERRAFERALHDGVQQDLVALGVRLQLARGLGKGDEALLTLLDEVERDLHDALDRVRKLSEQIYPSLLTLRGIVDALHAAASALGVYVALDAEGIERYPQDIEAAVYFSCRGVFRDASAGERVAVQLRQDGKALRFEIVARLAPPALTHMRDRVEALGGELTIDSKRGGATRVAALIPLYEPASAR